MPTCPARICATLLVCAGGLAAVDADVTRDYTWEEMQAGKDIHEDIYNSLSSGEFDEWRFRLGIHPGIDRIQVKSEISGTAYPGPAYAETDKVVNDPAVATAMSLGWILGDFDSATQGWFYGLSLDYVKRTYRILYAIGTGSTDLDLHALGVGMQMGYAWYTGPRVRFEVAPVVGVGIIWNELDLVSLESGYQQNKLGIGPYVEGGVRGAVVWHPAKTQAWHLGAELDYIAGYGQTMFHDKGPLGTLDSEARLWWLGFGASVFYGHRF